MATKALSGSYPAGFYLGPAYSSLQIDASATVGGSGVSTASSKAPTISNLGSVHGTASGVSLAGGGTLGNGSSTNSSASISGRAAIVATGGYASIFNAGSLTSDAVTTAKNSGTYTYAGPSVVLEGGGSFLNSTTSAQVSNGISIAGGTGLVINRGTIGGVYKGQSYTEPVQSTTSDELSIALAAGGTVLNGATDNTSAKISNGVSVSGAAGTVVNYGLVGGTYESYARSEDSYEVVKYITTGPSVDLMAGGSVTNGSVGSTSAMLSNGISISGGTGTVKNFGTIGSPSTYGQRDNYTSREASPAVSLGNGGSVVNGSAADTSARMNGGVYISGGGTVTNFGSIYAAPSLSGDYHEYTSYRNAVRFMQGGSLVNGSASSSSAKTVGMVGDSFYSTGGAVTVTNYGILSSAKGGDPKIYAVYFYSASDRLIEEGTGSILGRVAGGGGTLELGGAAGKGSINGIGFSVAGFNSVVVDAGPGWNLTGKTQVASGTTFENIATIGITGAFGNFATVDDIGGIGLGATGTISNTAEATITLDGSGGIGSLGNRTDIPLENAGAIVKTGSGTSIVHTSTINAGTIKVGGGTLDVTGAKFSNSGSVTVSVGKLDITGPVAGTGSLDMDGGTLQLDVAPSSKQNITFESGASSTLALGAVGTYTNRIAGFDAGDVLDLLSLQNGKVLSFSEAAGAAYGTLMVGNGTQTTSLRLYGTYMAADFKATKDAGGSGTAIRYTGPAPSAEMANPALAQALFDAAFAPASIANAPTHDLAAVATPAANLAIHAGKA